MTPRRSVEDLTAAQAKADVDAVDADEAIEDAEDAAAAVDEATEVQGVADVTDEGEPDEGSASDESDGASGQSEAEASGDDQNVEFAPAEWAGSVQPDADGNGPESHPIKGNADSMLYHNTESPHYGRTKAEVWFASEEAAEAAGFSKPGSQPTSDDNPES